MQNDASKKIAIMYASDYGYAASKECKNDLSNYSSSVNCKAPNNWIDNSTNTWLLPHNSSNYNYSFYMYSGSFVHDSSNVSGYLAAVYPVLSLSSNIKISGGSGTNSDPYTLSLK